MYEKVLEALEQARRSLSRGDIEARSAAISKASEILNELALSVNHEGGGEISRNLVELYNYIQQLLQRANFEQSEPPLAEAQRLVGTLLDAWEQCSLHPESPQPSPGVHDQESCAPVNCLG
jgi:flagellar protein FliS